MASSQGFHPKWHSTNVWVSSDGKIARCVAPSTAEDLKTTPSADAQEEEPMAAEDADSTASVREQKRKATTQRPAEVEDVQVPSADELAASFNPWTHPDYSKFHSWILTTDAFSLRSNAIDQGLLMDRIQVVTLQARERDGPVAHNTLLLNYAMPGGRNAFVKVIAAIARLYPAKSKEFEKLLTPP